VAPEVFDRLLKRPSDRPDTISEAFWIVLGRAPTASELDEYRRHEEHGGAARVLHHLLSSAEFHLIFSGWRDDIGTGRDPAAHEAGLRTLGTDDHFVRRAYELLLDREAGQPGLAHYLAALAAGEARRNVVRVLVTSDEFEARYTPIASQQGGGFVPRDVQLCELANPAKWDNPDWLRLLRSLGLPHHKLAMHRKSYEWTQLLFGLSRLGCLGERASVLSVGAGHECVLYWLANHAGRVVATDTYESRWQQEGEREGDETVLERPESYAPFPYRQDRLSFHRMDGRHLGFADAEFDVVYSLSSIEHFGGFEGARAATLEMARVLKPDGVLAVATEYILAGPSGAEAFLPEEIRALVDLPGLRLVEPIDEQVFRRFECRPVDLRHNRHMRPHMVVKDGATTFTTVIVFMRKISASGDRVIG
jgi:SAM-dependent methyltransferase